MNLRHALLIAALMLTGCDPVYGVRRHTTLELQPPLECIRQVIESAPGVTSVRYQNERGGRPLTFSGLQTRDVVDTFFYRGSDQEPIAGVLQVETNYKGEVRFSQYLWALHQAPPQRDVDATRPVMRYIEVALEAKCKIKGLSSRVTEACSGVACPPLK